MLYIITQHRRKVRRKVMLRSTQEKVSFCFCIWEHRREVRRKEEGDANMHMAMAMVTTMAKMMRMVSMAMMMFMMTMCFFCFGR